MNPTRVPTATYRLQFNQEFTFSDAHKIIPYLNMLGISHVYASPFLKARVGSLHGYNIVDHNALNPEIGCEADFVAYIEQLHRFSMGQIVDIVPNHMGVGGDDNAWWLHVLENGESSIYAAYFDIDWRPAKSALHNKVLLPFLGDHYGKILEQGELKLVFDCENGAFGVRYYEHLFPVDPRTYPLILDFQIERIAYQHNGYPGAFAALTELIADCKALPRRTDLSARQRHQRHQGIEVCKRQLANLYRHHPEIRDFISENITCFNGVPNLPSSFNRLHRLLEVQAYRLSYWKVASEEINYRRFFDINELAAMRMEHEAVFEVTHGLIGKMIRNGQINGLRIDHPDGLTDPGAYYHQLQKLIHKEMNPGQHGNEPHFGLWIEKILANFESLPSDWPVSGTTGYEAAFLLNGVLVRQQTEQQFNRIYSRFIGLNLSFDVLLYERKKLVTLHMLSGELTVLANLLNNIAQTNRHTRDFTYQGVRDALSEVVARFPVYRTYITAKQMSDADLRYVQWAIAQAKKNSLITDTHIFDFIGDILLLRHLADFSAVVRRNIVHFVLKFQQYTAPVMAKGLEDTTCYIYNRLASLNDVGFNPCAFGISVAAFHQENKQRQANWPHAMVTTSTHDSKRSEDVRARINVLSEIPDQWRRHLNRWSRLNRDKKRLIDDEYAPSRNDEYLIYQTLIGAWPIDAVETMENPVLLERFRLRIEAYMLKASKEAKVHTSWINPNAAYEDAIRYFIGALLDNASCNAFLADFIPFQQTIARFGLFNSLSQTLLKLTVPGVPDIYQGNECWTFDLVDPDNRHSIRYDCYQNSLQTLIDASETSENLSVLTRHLLEHMDDGRIKLYLTWRVIALRNNYPRLFNHGQYIGLNTRGTKANHICAFARWYEDQVIIVVAAREFVSLMGDVHDLPLGAPVWGDTLIEVPDDLPATSGEFYRNIFTGQFVGCVAIDGRQFFCVEDVLDNFSVALLIRE